MLHAIHVLHGRALAIRLVERNVSVALDISPHARVLEHGRLVLSGPGGQLLHDDRVRHAVLGL